MSTDHPPWPLPLGHKYASTQYGSLMYHDGRHDLRDRAAIKTWGLAYKARIRRPRYQPTGLYDGPTQRAVAECQKLAGLPATGVLGPDEWPLPWTLDPPPGAWVKPGGEHAEEQNRAHKVNVRDYWRRYSKLEVIPGGDPNAPTWFPGRPFGQREYGQHVKPVQEFFGHKTNGRFDRELASRIRGFQRANDLPVSGLVDARTAWLIEDKKNSPPP